MHRYDDIVADAASRWYGLHLGEHLARDRHLMVDRCAAMLNDTYALALPRARQIALIVLGDIEARGCAAYIDTDLTTSHTLFLVDPTNNQRIAFTAADLAVLARRHVGGSERQTLVHGACHPAAL